MTREDRRILPKTAAGRAVMDVIDAVLNEDDMPCGFDYDHAAVAAIDADHRQMVSEYDAKDEADGEDG